MIDLEWTDTLLAFGENQLFAWVLRGKGKEVNCNGRVISLKQILVLAQLVDLEASYTNCNSI